MRSILLINCILILLCCSSCGQSNNAQKKVHAPSHYDLNKPFVINLPQELSEISGVTYYQNDNSVFAIADEDGILYRISLQKPYNVKKWHFAKPGDYEDVTLVNNTLYVLQSNGNIYSFPLPTSNE